MKAARVLRFGPPNVITNDDLPLPEPAAEQLLVRVKAAGVGNWDALIREGKIELQPLPVILACLAPANLCKPTLLPQAEHAAKCLAFERTPTALRFRFQQARAHQERCQRSSDRIAPKEFSAAGR